MELKDRIAEIRKKETLSQREIAERLGVSLSSYQYYERGERIPTADFITNLITLFGVNADWLLTGEGPMERGGGEEHAPSGGPVNIYILKQIILMVEEVLKKQKKVMDPDAKALVISMAYDYVTEDTESEEEAISKMEGAKGKILQYTRAA